MKESQYILDKIFDLDIKDLIISILIILDALFLLFTFYTVNPFTVRDIYYFDYIVCFVIFCDFIYGLNFAEDKKAFFKDKYNWISIIAMIPVHSVIFRIIRFIKIAPLLLKGLIHFNKFLKKTHLNWSFYILLLAITLGTISFYISEHGVNPDIRDLWDSFTYVMPTIATAGSNTINPMTLPGTIIGIALMVIGIIAFGLFTASIASTFVKSDEKKRNIKDLNELKLLIKNMDNEIKELKNLLKEK